MKFILNDLYGTAELQSIYSKAHESHKTEIQSPLLSMTCLLLNCDMNSINSI